MHALNLSANPRRKGDRRLDLSLRDRDGSAITEMAFALPILCMILTGVFFLSLALYQKLQLAEAVSVGGRYLAVDRGDTDPCASTASKIYASAPGLKPSNLTLNFTLNGVASGPSCPGSSGNANSNMVPGANAQIDASYPCTVKFFNAFGTSNSTACTIKASIVEIIQ